MWCESETSSTERQIRKLAMPPAISTPDPNPIAGNSVQAARLHVLMLK